MASGDQKSTPFSLPAIAALAVISGVYFLARQPLKTSRPDPPTEQAHILDEEGEIDAMLWQDPLKVALNHDRTIHSEKESEESCCCY